MGAIIASTPDALLQSPHDAELASGSISLEAVRAELGKITSSRGFTATDRSRRLLEYLVNEALEGRGSRIKAYCIGTVVFGRPESFDPQADPIVRIEAARLRRELEHYYLTDGSDDPVIIDIPKGGYVPRFILREAGPPATTAPHAAATPGSTWWARHGLGAYIIGGLLVFLAGVMAYGGFNSQRQVAAPPAVQVPGLLIKPLADLTHSRESATLALGLTERIIEKIARFRELAVIPGDAGAGQTTAAVVRYEFGGTLRDDGDQLVLQTRLVDRMDGRVVWADSFSVALKPQQLVNIETAIADQIATRIAEPSGILFEAERRTWLESPPANFNAYLCTLRAYVYRATFAATKFPEVRACLEKAVSEHPEYATAWALLSLAYIDEFRFFHAAPSGNTTPALVRAHEAALRAVELDPLSIRGQQALMMTYFFRRQYTDMVNVGARALALNPNDVELKGDYGYRLALIGNWDEGCRLVQEALDSSGRKIGYFKTALALCHFYGDDLPAAASLVSDAKADDNPAYHVIAAAILAESGDAAASRGHREWLERNTPRQLTELLVELPQRFVRPIDRQRFLDALRKAGFPVAG